MRTATLAIVASGLAILGWIALPTQQGVVVLAIIAIVGVQAVRMRPPAREATGRRLRPTTVVNSILALGIAAIPGSLVVTGLSGGRTAAPIVLGIGLAAFGVIAFAVYSFAWAATHRATPAAILAVTVAGIVSSWLVLPGFLDQLAGRNPF